MTAICFYRVSKVVCDEQFVARAIQKFREWIETFSGNDQEGAQAFFKEIYSKIGQAHSEIHHPNVYMFRVALATIDSFGQKLFTPLEQILLQMLMTDEGEFNDLESDFDFHSEFLDMPEADEKAAQIDFMNEIMSRLNSRSQMC